MKSLLQIRKKKISNRILPIKEEFWDIISLLLSNLTETNELKILYFHNKIKLKFMVYLLLKQIWMQQSLDF